MITECSIRMTVSSNAQAAASVPEASAGNAREGILKLENEFALHFGGRLRGVEVAWRLVGAERGPVVVALGGISAGRYVTRSETGKGWWSEIVGPGAPLDTTRLQILGMDFLGGSGASTGPQTAQHAFPSVSAYDQAELLVCLMRHLGVPRLHAIVGASYGGMVALAFAERFGAHVERIVVISAADRPHPMSTAWRSVQRAIVRYALSKEEGSEGLRLARALAMATYRSPQEFNERFAGPPTLSDTGFSFPVERYLLARGDAYAASYRPEAFVCLSESIDLHQVDASKIAVPTTLVAVREDQLVPLEDMRALQARMRDKAVLIELSSLYGHDAFLKETAELRAVFARALAQELADDK
jgi:homoserine O-acetyltransferase/O-succinyltransferase